MSETFPVKIIARIHTDFPTKFGVPRQSGLIDSLESLIIFEPEYRDPLSLRGLEEFSHLWLIWQFSKAVRDTWSPGSASLQPARPSDRTPSGCPRCGCWGWRSIPGLGISCA